MTNSDSSTVSDNGGSTAEEVEQQLFYLVQFRDGGQRFTASGGALKLSTGTVVMVQTDHGLEPGRVVANAPLCGCREAERKAAHEIKRLATDSERDKYQNLGPGEQRAFTVCTALIEKHKLSMHLVRVERFFNGSKMIFYFTADNRVDFRTLVKDLVQEFRTRVEMRQVGVRHETKMIGGVGTCGRELCCSSFIKKFDSVSIKMAKEQDLPLNPTKISGLCNRLLCCLTYEYEGYKKLRKSMPKPGKKVIIDGEQYLIRRQMVIQDRVLAQNSSGEEVSLGRNEWRSFKPVRRVRSEIKEK
jgi:cell fate regulator YaaT (PSP1 superfamily)